MSKSIKNLAWLVADKIVRSLLALFVGAWIARYLGPENFGALSYGISVIGLLAVIANFGSHSIIVKEIVKDKENKESVIANGLCLQIVTSLAVFVACLALCVYLELIAPAVKDVIFVLAFSLLFKPAEIFKSLFEANVESKYSVIVENSAFFIMSACRIALIFLGAGLMWFVWSIVAEALIIAIGYILAYKYIGGVFVDSRRDWGKIKKLALDSFPLMASGIAVSIYMRIDQLMLGNILDVDAVGIYAAALKISEVWYFIPGIVASTFYPKLFEIYNSNSSLYYKKLKNLLSCMVLFSVFLGFLFLLFSENAVELIYGDRYLSAVSVLKIHIWTGLFVALGLISYGWYLNEGLQNLLFYRTLFGAAFNILLNLILIPDYGVVGAALGTLGAQILANYFFDLLNPRTRIIFLLKTHALTFGLINLFARKF